MNTSTVCSLTSLVALVLFAEAAPVQAGDLVVYTAQPAGSSVKIDGSCNIHDWTVEGKIIGGRFEVDPSFALTGTPAAGKVNAKAKASIPITSLKSGKSRMDEVMQENMKATEFPRIEYQMLDMTLKQSPKSATDPLVFDTVGKLTISGVSRTNAMEVTCSRTNASRLTFTTVANLKMTDFGITPPSPTIALGLITTRDEVKVTLEWVTKQRADPAATK